MPGRSRSDGEGMNEQIEYPDYWPCYFCEGTGWIWDAHINRKRRCPVCKGMRIEENEEEDADE